MGFLGGPTDRVGASFNFFVRPLSKLCISDVHLRVREKHVLYSHQLTSAHPRVGLPNKYDGDDRRS